MITNALAPCYTRSSAAMAFTMHNQHLLVFYESGFNYLYHSYSKNEQENASIFFMFLPNFSGHIGLMV